MNRRRPLERKKLRRKNKLPELLKRKSGSRRSERKNKLLRRKSLLKRKIEAEQERSRLIR